MGIWPSVVTEVGPEEVSDDCPMLGYGIGTGPAGVGVLQTSGKVGLIPPLPLCAIPRLLANVVGISGPLSVGVSVVVHRLAGVSTRVQPRAPRSDAAQMSAGPCRWPAARAAAASTVRTAPVAAPVSPKQLAGCSRAMSGENRSLCRSRATPQSLASKFSPLRPVKVEAIGPGDARRPCNSWRASASPSPRAGSVP